VGAEAFPLIVLAIAGIPAALYVISRLRDLRHKQHLHHDITGRYPRRHREPTDHPHEPRRRTR